MEKLTPGTLTPQWRTLLMGRAPTGTPSLTPQNDALVAAMPPIEITPAEITATLHRVNADDYDTWVKVGMALHHQFDGSTDGLDLWEDWSSTSAKFVPGECERKWPTFAVTGRAPVTFRSVLELAKAGNGLSPTATAMGYADKFRILTPDETTIDRSCTEYLIKSLLERRGLGVMYGPSGAGKSFLALTMAWHMATGTAFIGHRARPSRVLYISLEGATGFRKRVAAMNEQAGFPKGEAFSYVCARGSDFADPAFKSYVCETIRQRKVDCVIIDTLARFLGGADENTAPGMAVATDFADAVFESSGAAMLFVHHSGKDALRGARGHSSLKAAVDLEIAVARDDEKGRHFVLQKVKDGEDGKAFRFKLEVVNLGYDDEGDPLTTCLATDIAPLEAAPKQDTRKPTASQVKFLELMTGYIAETGESTTIGGVDRVAVQRGNSLFQYLYDEGWLLPVLKQSVDGPWEDAFPVPQSNRDKVQTQLKGLKGKGFLDFNKEFIWLT